MPSPQPVPSASAEKALQRPSGDSPCWRLNSMKMRGRRHDGRRRRPGPWSIRHLRRAWAARCRATSDEEQAVSIVTAGPSSPKV